MINRWSENDKLALINENHSYSPEVNSQAYSTRLLGSDSSLTLHGGGNTSVKTTIVDIVGQKKNALFVKSSGTSMATFSSNNFVVMDLDYLQKLQQLKSMDDTVMEEQFRLHSLVASDARPSIETLMHAFLPYSFISHTHPDSILALTNREKGQALTKKILGDEIAVIPYVQVGFALAQAVANAVNALPNCKGIVIGHHGLVTWGESAKEAYDRTIFLVSKAEVFLDSSKKRKISGGMYSIPKAQENFKKFSSIIRGVMCPLTDDMDNPIQRMITVPIINDNILSLLSSSEANQILVSVPLTPDYIIRTRTLPLFIKDPDFENEELFKKQLTHAVEEFKIGYASYIERNRKNHTVVVNPSDLMPRIICIPGLGIICAGVDIVQATMIRDITEHAVAVKMLIYETDGNYSSIDEDHLFDMEFRTLQKVKLGKIKTDPLQGSVAIVTGSAGAIGCGIVEALLDSGCHVAITDLSGQALDDAGKRFRDYFGSRAETVAMDVTNEESVEQAFNQVTIMWGGVDIVIVNAGIAHVSPLADMDLARFKKLESVNVDGALLTIRESARLLKKQSIGGDIIMISTKNVFAPGAKFGAYSATKAAAHQLARIAVLELADSNVRVNMVAPDAVFSHGSKRSGLWAEVGPDRMKARGLDEKGLEEYYRSRNLLKAKVTAEHVGKAVLFFVTHQTPTTGATIPVDGGLPDATPR